MSRALLNLSAGAVGGVKRALLGFGIAAVVSSEQGTGEVTRRKCNVQVHC